MSVNTSQSSRSEEHPVAEPLTPAHSSIDSPTPPPTDHHGTQSSGIDQENEQDTVDVLVRGRKLKVAIAEHDYIRLCPEIESGMETEAGMDPRCLSSALIYDCLRVLLEATVDGHRRGDFYIFDPQIWTFMTQNNVNWRAKFRKYAQEAKYVLVPLFNVNHWLLAVFQNEPDGVRAYAFDSLTHSRTEAEEAFTHYETLCNGGETGPSRGHHQIGRKRYVCPVEQRNNYDCGIYLLYFAEQVFRQPERWLKRANEGPESMRWNIPFNVRAYRTSTQNAMTKFISPPRSIVVPDVQQDPESRTATAPCIDDPAPIQEVDVIVHLADSLCTYYYGDKDIQAAHIQEMHAAFQAEGVKNMEQRCCILVTDLNDAQFEEIDAELRSKLRATGHPDANRVNKVLKRSVPYELLKGRHRKETLDMQIFQKTRATTDAWWRCRVIDKKSWEANNPPRDIPNRATARKFTSKEAFKQLYEESRQPGGRNFFNYSIAATHKGTQYYLNLHRALAGVQCTGILGPQHVCRQFTDRISQGTKVGPFGEVRDLLFTVCHFPEFELVVSSFMELFRYGGVQILRDHLREALRDYRACFGTDSECASSSEISPAISLPGRFPQLKSLESLKSPCRVFGQIDKDDYLTLRRKVIQITQYDQNFHKTQRTFLNDSSEDTLLQQYGDLSGLPSGSMTIREMHGNKLFLFGRKSSSSFFSLLVARWKVVRTHEAFTAVLKRYGISNRNADVVSDLETAISERPLVEGNIEAGEGVAGEADPKNAAEAFFRFFLNRKDIINSEDSFELSRLLKDVDFKNECSYIWKWLSQTQSPPLEDDPVDFEMIATPMTSKETTNAEKLGKNHMPTPPPTVRRKSLRSDSDTGDSNVGALSPGRLEEPERRVPIVHQQLLPDTPQTRSKSAKRMNGDRKVLSSQCQSISPTLRMSSLRERNLSLHNTRSSKHLRQPDGEPVAEVISESQAKKSRIQAASEEIRLSPAARATSFSPTSLPFYMSQQPVSPTDADSYEVSAKVSARLFPSDTHIARAKEPTLEASRNGQSIFSQNQAEVPVPAFLADSAGDQDRTLASGGRPSVRSTSPPALVTSKTTTPDTANRSINENVQDPSMHTENEPTASIPSPHQVEPQEVSSLEPAIRPSSPNSDAAPTLASLLNPIFKALPAFDPIARESSASDIRAQYDQDFQKRRDGLQQSLKEFVDSIMTSLYQNSPATTKENAKSLIVAQAMEIFQTSLEEEGTPMHIDAESSL